MATFKITTTNSRYQTLPGTPAFPASEGTSGADTLTVDAGAYLISTDHGAAILDPLGAWTVNANGAIISSNGTFGISHSGTAALTINVGVEGSIGALSNGINAGSTGATTIKNAGTIFGSSAAIDVSGKTTLINSGLIDGRGLNKVAFDNSEAATSITNSGVMNGDIWLFANHNAHKITNSGTINGDLLLADGNDIVANSGRIGRIEFEGGNNKFTNSGQTGDANFGSGDDTLTNTGVMGSGARLGSGNNVAYNSGNIRGIIFGDDDDKFTNSGNISNAVTMGHGDNVLINSGRVSFGVQFGDGDDTFTNNGKNSFVNYDVELDHGNNKFSNAGEVGKHVSALAGQDQITNSGILHTVYLGIGDDKVINSGLIDDLDTYDQNDTVTNSGTITNLNVSSGNDVVNNTGYIGKAFLGMGDDKYTGGAKVDSVYDDDGSDNINLGGGNDRYFVLTPANDGIDTIDGGAGVDLYDAAVAGIGVNINLDNVAHNFAPANVGLTLAASKAAQGAEVDNIKNFENATGSNLNDNIAGSAAANVLLGGLGNDTIFGYAGNDIIEGGTGTDTIMGGAGADKLTGGTENDSFYYTALTDSGVGVGKRDVITDFADGDSLVFIIDVNSKSAGFQRFNYLNDDFGNVQNANFTGNAGELRSIWTATGYLIEGDVNGDAKADFQIEILNSAHSLTFNTFKINDDILVLD